MQVFDERDRRRWPRAASKLSQLTVWRDSTLCQDAVVLDESLTGFSLLVEDGWDFHEDQEVRLTYDSQEAFAVVRHVDRRTDGKYHVGLQWGPAEISPAFLNLLLTQLGETTSTP